MGTKSAAAAAGGGEIIQVQGGHIVRATGRKDRHSKVHTAKGPRDRRVRLSAHTAIQFYDVQDRLGYDRPSKAVDWLIKKAKSAIDKLVVDEQTHIIQPLDQNTLVETQPDPRLSADVPVDYQEQHQSAGSNEYDFQITRQMGGVDDHHLNQRHYHQREFQTSFLGPVCSSQPLDADAMKSLFPITSSTATLNFQAYPRNHHVMSRTANTSQDLGLSLRSFHGNSNHPAQTDQQTFFPGSSAFEANFRNFGGWNHDTSVEERGLAFAHQPFLVPPHLADQASSANFLNMTQRGTLQSSYSQSPRSWADLPVEKIDHQNNKTEDIHHGSSLFGTRFGLQQGFSVPARIHGIASDRPASSSPPTSSQ